VHFRHNQFGAVSISSSPNVIVKNCTFDNNTSDKSNATFGRFQPSAGGLSISCINEDRITISIIVTECCFSNNTDTSSNVLNSSRHFLSRGTSGSRGGGLAIAVRANRSVVNCVVNNSVFINNTSSGTGGGLFCITVRAHGHQTYTLENLIFINNRANIAGALFYRSRGRGNRASVDTKIINCVFMENSATIAGAVTITFYDRLFNDNSVKFNGCTFTKNLATDFAGTVDIVSSYNFFVDRSRYIPIAFTDW